MHIELLTRIPVIRLVNMQNKMETAGKLVYITVTKGKCFALDRTPWCKNNNSLHMSNAQRCFKLRHAKVQQKGSVLCLIEPRGVKTPIHYI